MNRLLPPDFFDDNEALDALSLNNRLKSFPHLQPHVVEIKAAYQQYISESGDATSVNNLPLPEAIQNYLKGLYASPPADIAYIESIRENSDADCCPMCGSFHSGTLDHLLPKTAYPVFAIFGCNLVPACKCNSKRGEHTIGANPGERILHPYFDDILSQRLFVAHFDDLGRIPQITLRPCIEPDDASFPAVRFHIKNVVERTSILRHIRKSWTQMLRRPNLTAAELKNTPGTRQQLRQILTDELDRQDDIHGSRNNWLSVFIAGLLDDHVLDWLFASLQRPGRLPNSPLVENIT